ncbi:hypothetical protein [Azospirillum sp. sgz301742]
MVGHRGRCTIVWVPIAELAGRHLPILILADGNVSATVTDYAIDLIARRSCATVDASVRSIALLFDFHGAQYGGVMPPAKEQERFFHLFVSAIENGTMAIDGSDPTGLGWQPRPTGQVKRIVQRCAEFLAFASRQSDVSGLGGFAWVVERVLDEAERRRDANASYSFFAHLRQSKQPRRPWFTQGAGWMSGTRRAVGFPPHKITPLIATTLTNPRAEKAARVRDALAWVLLAYGGIRSSELFHIWLTDILLEGGSARVFLRHPSDFSVKVRGKRVTRRMHLADQYGSLPRHLLPIGDSFHAGWKGISFDYDNTAVIHWIDPRAGELFASLHYAWLTKLRPSTPDHPYYFVSVDRSGDFGGPWTIGAFRDAFRSACLRLGLRPNQSEGVCPHGLRHAYGLAAEAMNLPSSIIQEMMHHRHPLSQEAYKKKRPEEVSKKIVEASRRLQTGDLIIPAYDEQFWYSDPRKLFNGWRFG